jgi:hypothetical protein
VIAAASASFQFGPQESQVTFGSLPGEVVALPAPPARPVMRSGVVVVEVVPAAPAVDAVFAQGSVDAPAAPAVPVVPAAPGCSVAATPHPTSSSVMAKSVFMFVVLSVALIAEHQFRWCAGLGSRKLVVVVA